MPLLDKKIPGWLKGAVAGMLLLTIGHFVYQTFFVGWREYQVLMLTDLPFGRAHTLYDVYLDGRYRGDTFFIKPAQGDAFGLYGTKPLRSTKRYVTVELVPSSTGTARSSYRFEIVNDAESQWACEIVVRLRNGEPTIEGCANRDYDASNFAFFVNLVN
jgi:hypothetical protein